MQIVTFKWNQRPDELESIPSQALINYGADHVNIFYRMMDRNLNIPYEKVCITDDPEGLDKDIRVIPLWDKYRYLGGCYNRLYVFSSDMQELIGDRFFVCDVDVVITSNMDSIIDREEDFVIGHQRRPDLNYLRYHGGMFLMNAGCRSRVWDIFNLYPKDCIRRAKEFGYIGTDQAIIRLLLKDEAGWTQKDGVLDMRVDIMEKGIIDPPDGTKIIQFSGPRDPTNKDLQDKYKWIEKNYY